MLSSKSVAVAIVVSVARADVAGVAEDVTVGVRVRHVRDRGTDVHLIADPVDARSFLQGPATNPLLFPAARR